MIRGVGVDAVPVARMRLALERTPRLAERVFTSHELETVRVARVARSVARRAFRGEGSVPEGARRGHCRGGTSRWCRDDRVPTLRVAGHDDAAFHVSLTHTDDVAVAVVVAEAEAWSSVVPGSRS